jgi:signal transduction histidine kinase
VQLKLAAQLSRAGSPVDPDHVDDLHVQTREAIDELRELARGIYPSLLAERGLADALRGLVDRAQQRVTIGCDDGLGLTPAAEAAVYFICTEALQNVAKHAGADATATVEVRRAGDVVSVTIRDDGRGFDAAEVAGSRGLLNMRDRVGALGGELVIDSGPGAGSTLIATVPVEPASSALAEPIADGEVRT